MNENIKNLLIRLFLAFAFCQISMLSFAQISLFEEPEADKVKSETILYDSLYNFKKQDLHKEPNYDYLIGQRLFFYKDYDLYGSTRNYLEVFSSKKEDYIPGSKFVGKYFDVISVTYGKYSPKFTLIETSSKDTIFFTSMNGFDNDNWVVQGYYEKAKQDYVGKTFILNNNGFRGDALLSKETGRIIPDIPKGTEFLCTGISVKADGGYYERGPERSNVILLFNNKDYGDCYLFLDKSFGGQRDRRTLDLFLTKEDYQKELALKEQQAKERKLALQKRQAAMIKKYGKYYGTLISQGKVKIGMTREMCRQAWGEPDDINTTTGSFGKYEQWVYGYNSYLYFENGKLTTIQN